MPFLYDIARLPQLILEGYGKSRVSDFNAAEEKGLPVFTWVKVSPHKRVQTTFVVHNKAFRLLALWVWVIPTPVYVLFNVTELFTQPILFIIGYLSIFIPLLGISLVVSMFVALFSLLANPHLNRTGMGLHRDYEFGQDMKSGLAMSKTGIFGIANISWKDIAEVKQIGRRELVILFVQPEQWWRRLVIYPGIKLTFATAKDVDMFIKQARNFKESYIARKDKSPKIQSSQKMTVEERKLTQRILHGHDQL